MESEIFINDKFAIDELIRRSWNHCNSKAFSKFFDFVAKFHHYSRYNTMLVYLQNEAVTFFGGESYWRKNFKRTIKKEARPYVILAPMSPVMLVYDIMDTEGLDKPEVFLEKGLGEKPFEVKGKINPDNFHGAVQIAKNWGIPVIYRERSYFNAGFVTTAWSGRLEICLKEGMNTEQNFTVLLHELAHVLLGHTGHKELHKSNPEKRMVLPERKNLTRNTEELEAETVSFLISKKMGLETRSAEYIAGYLKDTNDLLRFSYETVIKVADKIDSLFLKSTGMMNTPKQQSLF